MEPNRDIFSNVDEGFRGMAWPGNQYVLGTNRIREGIVAQLPDGMWSVTRFDVVNKEELVLAEKAKGMFRFDSPESRAVLFFFQKN